MKFSPYRTLNTLRLCFKNQLVNAVQGNNRCCSETHTKHINTLCGQNVETVTPNPVVSTVTVRFNGLK